ncbi:hypothetical protein, partial [Paenibacillus sp. AR247]|uniref:hypothetical protein n=1 Tax=Paenibacillus sp. AR247 TaxID=1631599 RepID=UPI000CF86FB6
MDEEVIIQTNQQQVIERSSKLTIAAMVVAIIGVLVAIATWYFTNSLATTKINDLKVKMESESAAIRDENAALKQASEALSAQLDAVKNVALLTAVAHDIEGAVVTDDFVIEKIDLVANDNGQLGNVIIDVDNQPDMALVYKGKGAYELTDREIRAKCDSIIREASARYGTV